MLLKFHNDFINVFNIIFLVNNCFTFGHWPTTEEEEKNTAEKYPKSHGISIISSTIITKSSKRKYFTNLYMDMQAYQWGH